MVLNLRPLLLAACLLGTLGVFPAYAAMNNVAVDQDVLNSLGQPPNTASLYIAWRQGGSAQPERVGGYYPFSPEYPERGVTSALQAPPSHMPKSRVIPASKAKPGGVFSEITPAMAQATRMPESRVMWESMPLMPPKGYGMGMPKPKRNADNWPTLPSRVISVAPYGYDQNLRPERNLANEWGHRRIDAMPGMAMGGGSVTAIKFEFGETDLPDGAIEKLKTAANEIKNGNGRAQLFGYASAEGQDLSRVRRTAYSRVLAVRNALIQMGIAGAQLSIKAMGIATDNGPPDRVDVAVGR
ncbi:MAG: hypothetical protein AB7U41_05270 [Dongiaceae bacterium]